MIAPVSQPIDFQSSSSSPSSSPFMIDRNPSLSTSPNSSLDPESSTSPQSIPSSLFLSSSHEPPPISEIEALHRKAFDSLRKSITESDLDFTSRLRTWETSRSPVDSTSSILSTSPPPFLAPPCSPERALGFDLRHEEHFEDVELDDDGIEQDNVIVASTIPIFNTTSIRASGLTALEPSSLPSSTPGLFAPSSSINNRQFEVEELSRRLKIGFELDDFAAVREWQEKHQRRVSTTF